MSLLSISAHHIQQWFRVAPVERSLAVVGGLCVTNALISALQFLHRNYPLLGSTNLRLKYQSAGNWAVITGGSEGIGFAMARELARQGFSVIIIALDEPLLYESAERLRGAFPDIEVDAVPFNFLTTDEGQYAALFAHLDTRDVSVLVNNVGGFYRYPKPLEVASVDEDLRLLKLNMEPQVRLTKHLLPRFKGIGTGAIVNLSSYSALVPTPLMSVYAASKAFNLAFSKSVAAEVAGTNIDVLAVTPLFVSTRITQGLEDKPLPVGEKGTVCPTEMAQHTLQKLGRCSQTCGHRLHEWISALIPSIGRLGQRQFLRIAMNMFRENQAKEATSASSSN